MSDMNHAVSDANLKARSGSSVIGPNAFSQSSHKGQYINTIGGVGEFFQIASKSSNQVSDMTPPRRALLCIIATNLQNLKFFIE